MGSYEHVDPCLSFAKPWLNNASVNSHEQRIILRESVDELCVVLNIVTLMHASIILY